MNIEEILALVAVAVVGVLWGLRRLLQRGAEPVRPLPAPVFDREKVREVERVEELVDEVEGEVGELNEVAGREGDDRTDALARRGRRR